MEILQKITLYDLLGYAVPGTILAGIAECCYFSEHVDWKNLSGYIGYICAITILLGYVIGIAISEATDLIYTFLKKQGLFKMSNAFLDYTVIAAALEKAGAITDRNSIKSIDDTYHYFTYMYSDIQTDKNYSRIHNYASAELTCKNMAFVVLAATIMLCVRKIIPLPILIIAGIILELLFLRRWNRQRSRKEMYTVQWFVQKHASTKKSVEK